MGIPDNSLEETLAKCPDKPQTPIVDPKKMVILNRADLERYKQGKIDQIARITESHEKCRETNSKLMKIRDESQKHTKALESEIRDLKATIIELKETESDELYKAKESLAAETSKMHQKDDEIATVKGTYENKIRILQDTIRELEQTANQETLELRSKYDEAVAEIAELKDIMDEEMAKINLYNDLKKMVPELKRCLLANSTNQDTKELSEKPSSSAMIKEQKKSNSRATESAIEQTGSDLILDSIISNPEENDIELDEVRATKEQIKPENKSTEQIDIPEAIKSKSKSKPRAKTAPEKIADPELIKSSSGSKSFKMTKRKEKILKFLKDNPGSYNAEISKGLKMSTGDVSKLLKELTAEGLTTRNEDGQYDLGKQ